MAATCRRWFIGLLGKHRIQYLLDRRRSRDNFPNPIAARDNPHVPLNTPAIGDLFDLFAFDDNTWF